eukprot:ctg_648.g158
MVEDPTRSRRPPDTSRARSLAVGIKQKLDLAIGGGAHLRGNARGVVAPLYGRAEGVSAAAARVRSADARAGGARTAHHRSEHHARADGDVAGAGGCRCGRRRVSAAADAARHRLRLRAGACGGAGHGGAGGGVARAGGGHGAVAGHLSGYERVGGVAGRDHGPDREERGRRQAVHQAWRAAVAQCPPQAARLLPPDVLCILLCDHSVGGHSGASVGDHAAHFQFGRVNTCDASAAREALDDQAGAVVWLSPSLGALLHHGVVRAVAVVPVPDLLHTPADQIAPASSAARPAAGSAHRPALLPVAAVAAVADVAAKPVARTWSTCMRGPRVRRALPVDDGGGDRYAGRATACCLHHSYAAATRLNCASASARSAGG